MVAFTIGGDFTWTGNTAFSGAFTINDASTVLINTTGDIEIDGVYTYVYGNTQLDLDSPTIIMGTSQATSITIGSTSVTSFSATGSAISLTGSSGSIFTDATTITLDTPNLLIGLTLCTNLGIGNGDTGIYIACNLWQCSSSGPINMSGTSGSSYTDTAQVNIDSGANVLIGVDNATIIQFGNAAANLVMYGVLPAAIGGSVPVLWDPVSKQFSHT